jgi:hypothetical protein
MLATLKKNLKVDDVTLTKGTQVKILSFEFGQNKSDACVILNEGSTYLVEQSALVFNIHEGPKTSE